ncbi:MAG: DNA-processing protein DprA [Actinobacteria bacterium]|nr:DNA-processing protein DprA [Actinomycetota bacterium]
MIELPRDDPRYPTRLDDLADPPATLYVREPVQPDALGELLRPPIVAIVGSRNASAAGIAFATRLAGELAASGVGVISGLARGIDAGAHQGTLDRSGRTVAVLGCGIDRDYPSATIPLARRIAAEGAILSEYPPGTPPAPFRFPERNRIVAALADATIVIEAAARSGALITARLALDLGRDVLAVPGAPWSSGAEGTNLLLKDGALPLTAVADALVCLGLDPGTARVDDPAIDASARRVLAALRREPASADVLAARCGLTSSAAAALIAELELKGLLVRELDGRLVPTA